MRPFEGVFFTRLYATIVSVIGYRWPAYEPLATNL